MKISKQRLKQIIKEELSSIMYEGDPDGDGDDAAELRDMADQLEGGGKTYPQAEMESTMSMKVPTQELKRVERSMMGGKYITFTKRQLANIIVSVNGQEHYLAKLLEEYDDTMYPPEDYSEKTHFPPATIEDLDVFLEDVVTYGQGRMTQEQKQAALDKVNALMREEGLGIEGAIEEVLDDLGIT